VRVEVNLRRGFEFQENREIRRAALVRRYTLQNSLVDIPNARSSHTSPTPRGRGAIIVVWFLMLAILVVLRRLDEWVGLALLAGGGLVAGGVAG